MSACVCYSLCLKVYVTAYAMGGGGGGWHGKEGDQGEGDRFNIALCYAVKQTHCALFAYDSESDSETPFIARLGISLGVVCLQCCLVVA